MAKSITREVTVYCYKFAHVDASTLQIHDMVEIHTPESMGPRSLSAKGKELDGRIFISGEKKTCKYELPLDRFISACEQYAKEIQDQAES